MKNNPQTLSAEDIAQLQHYADLGHRQAYWARLADKGYAYAELAGGVARNDTLFGKTANNFAEGRAKDLGVELNEIQWHEVGVSLMEADWSLRKDLLSRFPDATAELPYKDIRDYHEAVFKGVGLDLQAWTAHIPLQYADDPDAQWAEFLELAGTDDLEQFTQGLGILLSNVEDVFADGVADWITNSAAASTQALLERDGQPSNPDVIGLYRFEQGEWVVRIPASASAGIKGGEDIRIPLQNDPAKTEELNALRDHRIKLQDLNQQPVSEHAPADQNLESVPAKSPEAHPLTYQRVAPPSSAQIDPRGNPELAAALGRVEQALEIYQGVRTVSNGVGALSSLSSVSLAPGPTPGPGGVGSTGTNNGLNTAISAIGIAKSIAEGDPIGAAIGMISMANPVVGTVLTVLRMTGVLDSLFGGGSPAIPYEAPEAYASYQYGADGTVTISHSARDANSGDILADTLQGRLGDLAAHLGNAPSGLQLATVPLQLALDSLNTEMHAQQALIPERLPRIHFDGHNYQVSFTDASTGAEVDKLVAPADLADAVVPEYEAQTIALGRALAQYAAYAALARGWVEDENQVRLFTVNGLGGQAGLQKLYGDKYDPSIGDDIDNRHLYIDNDVVVRLGDGHLGGEYQVLDTRSPDTGLMLDPLTAHKVSTVLERLPSQAFASPASSQAPDYLDLSTTQPLARLIGDLHNTDGRADTAESWQRLSAGVIGAATARHDLNKVAYP